MTHEIKLKSLSDDELLHRLAEMSKQSRRVEATLVAHIGEVDHRRLYGREGSPSMFQYCLDVLHLSESEAYRRIAAARLSRNYPLILTMLDDGRLHLAGISVLRKHLTDANYQDVLARAAHKTKREIEILVAELAPKPDVPPTIRKRPQQKANPEPPRTSSQLCPDTVEPVEPARQDSHETQKVAPAPPQKPATLEPLAPARYKVAFTASEELRGKLKRLEALLPGKDLAEIIDAAVSEKLQRLEAKRFGKTQAPRKSVEQSDTTPASRYIPTAVRRVVYERDGGRCTYVSPEGRRCSERTRLEFHHVRPFARGGGRAPENIRLVCRAHNGYQAELDYGKELVDRYRKRAGGVSEPAPVYFAGDYLLSSVTTSITQMLPMSSDQMK